MKKLKNNPQKKSQKKSNRGKSDNKAKPKNPLLHTNRTAINARINICKWLEELFKQGNGDANAVLIKLTKCGSRSLFDVSRGNARLNVKLNASAKGAVLWSGLARCGRSSCPICCDIKSKALMLESTAWVFKNRDAISKNENALMTLTRWHSYNSCPKDLFDDLHQQMKILAEWFEMYGKRYKRRKKKPFRGYVGCLEITWGDNGLHFHWHIYYTSPQNEIRELKSWHKNMVAKYTEKSLKLGMKVDMPDSVKKKAFKLVKKNYVDKDTGKTVKCDVKSILNYINKGLWETTGNTNKVKHKRGGRSIFDVNSVHSAKMFLKFFEITKHKRFLRLVGDCSTIKKQGKENVEKAISRGDIDFEESMKTIYEIDINDIYHSAKVSKCNDVAEEITTREIIDMDVMKTLCDDIMNEASDATRLHKIKCDDQPTIHKSYENENGDVIHVDTDWSHPPPWVYFRKNEIGYFGPAFNGNRKYKNPMRVWDAYKSRKWKHPIYGWPMLGTDNILYWYYHEKLNADDIKKMMMNIHPDRPLDYWSDPIPYVDDGEF